ncbi:MAG: hypothetical protein ACLPID_17735 [Beijerinckiaceae bacterium]
MRPLAMSTDPQNCTGSFWARFAGAGVFCVCVALGSSPAKAYRPFDGTDASVAELGQFELELQPFGALQEGPTKTLVAPASVFNFGFAKDWEAVLQGQLDSQISPSTHESLTGNGVFLKHVLLPGVLQDQPGPSIATEFGLLLPSLGVRSAIGPSWDWILSQRFEWGTIHLNFTTSLASDQRADLNLDVILEGPANWKLRPVAEIYSDSLIGGAQTYSGLVGAIWQIRDDLALDLAVRHAISGGRQVNELRAGMTIAFPFEPSPEPVKAWQPAHTVR